MLVSRNMLERDSPGDCLSILHSRWRALVATIRANCKHLRMRQRNDSPVTASHRQPHLSEAIRCVSSMHLKISSAGIAISACATNGLVHNDSMQPALGRSNAGAVIAWLVLTDGPQHVCWMPSQHRLVLFQTIHNIFLAITLYTHRVTANREATF